MTKYKKTRAYTGVGERVSLTSFFHENNMEKNTVMHLYFQLSKIYSKKHLPSN